MRYSLIIICLISSIALMAQEMPEIFGYYEDFSHEVDMDFWDPNIRSHDSGRPVFIVNQADSSLKIEMSQLEFSDGQSYEFHDEIVYLVDHPYASMKIRVEPGVYLSGVETSELPVNVTPFSQDSIRLIRQHDFTRLAVPADGEWYELFFNWSRPDDRPNDYSELSIFRLETTTWPETYAATFWIDDFKIGDQVDFIPIDSIVIVECGDEGTGVIPVGDSRQFYAEVYPAEATSKHIIWSVNNEGLALIDQDGRLTALFEGKVNVYARARCQAYMNSTCRVEISERVGVEEAGKLDINYYPNPVDDILNVTGFRDAIRLELYNTAGQKVIVQHGSNGTVSMNLSHLDPGIYILRGYSAHSKVFTHKIVKK